MTNKLLIGTAAVIAAGFAALFGGVLDRPAAAPPDALASSQSVEDFKAGFALNAEHRLARREPAGDARREQGRPAQLDAARPRLRAARPRDRRPELLRQGRRRAEPRARARRRRPARDQRPRLARALAPPLRARARSSASKALQLAPSTARHYGVIGDAEIELGRYRQAFRDFDAMNRLRPSLSSYARVSYGRELIGNTAGAIAAMKLAIDAATDTAEPTAWTHVQLGKLYFNHGRYAAAEREFRLRERGLPALRLRARRARRRARPRAGSSAPRSPPSARRSS